MADGTIKIDVDIPVGKVKSDAQEINDELNKIGNHSGDKLDQHLRENSSKAKSTAKETERSLDQSLNKDYKSKIKVDSSEAKRGADEVKSSLEKVPKEKETRLKANNSNALEKGKEVERQTNRIPKDHTTDLKAEDHTSNIFQRIRDHIKGTNKEANQTRHILSHIAIGSAIGSGLSNMFSSMASGFKNSIHEGLELNEGLENINASFKNMGMSRSRIKSLDDQIAYLKRNVGLTGDEAAGLQKQMLNWSVIGVGGARKLTTAVAEIGAGSRMTGDQIAMMGAQLMRVGSSGKVTASTLNRITRNASGFYQVLARGAGMSVSHLRAVIATGKVTQAQFQTWMANSAKYANGVFKDYSHTQLGAMAQIKASWELLEADMTKPLFSVKNSGMSDLATLMKSKPVQQGAGLIGKGLRNIAVYAMRGLGYISRHRKDLSEIASDVIHIGGELAKDVWKDFSDIIFNIARDLGLVHKNNDSLKDLTDNLNDISRNRKAIKFVADAIVTIAMTKGLFTVADALKEIAGIQIKPGSVIAALKGGLSSNQTGSTLRGLFTSEKNGGFNKIGKLAWGIQLAFNAADIGSSLAKIFTSHSVTGRVQNATTASSKAILHGIAYAIGGPYGPLVDAFLTPLIDWASNKAGKAAKSWLNGWNDYNKGHKPNPIKQPIEYHAYEAHSLYNRNMSRRHNEGKGWIPETPKEYENFDWNKGLGYNFLVGVNNQAASLGHLFDPRFYRTHNPRGSVWGRFMRWAETAPNPFRNVKLNWGAWSPNNRANQRIIRWWNGIRRSFRKLKAPRLPKFHLPKVNAKKWASNVYKNIRSGWRGFKGWASDLGRRSNKAFREKWHGMESWSRSVHHNFRKGWDGFRSWIGNLSHHAVVFFKSHWRGMQDWAHGVSGNLRSGWHGTKSWFKSLGSRTARNFKSGWDRIVDWFKDKIHGIKEAWDDFWNNLGSGLGKFVHGKIRIGSLHLANGTDWRSKWIPAVLNDGSDSPSTNNRESIIHGDGSWELLPNIRFLKRWLAPSDDVVNAKDTADLVNRFGRAVHFAGGTLNLSDLGINVSRSQENTLKSILNISGRQLSLALSEARRKQNKAVLEDRQNKSLAKSVKSLLEPLKKRSKRSIDDKRHKGDVLVDKGLLGGFTTKETGKETWINQKLFNRLMNYTKATPIKVRKNSRIRYHELPVRRSGKDYEVDSHWLTGAKKATGVWEKLTHEQYLKLLDFTKKQREYKLPKKKKKRKKRKAKRRRTTRRRSERRRTTERRRSTSTRTEATASGVRITETGRRRSTRRRSTRRRSTRSSSSSASVSASVKGLSKIKELSKAIRKVRGVHRSRIRVQVHGEKSVKSLQKRVKKVAGVHRVKVRTRVTGSREVVKLGKDLRTLAKRSRSARSAVSKIRSATRRASSGLRSLRSSVRSTQSRIRDLYEATKKDKFGKVIGDQAKEAVKDLRGKGNFAKEFEKLSTSTRKTLKDLKSTSNKDFRDMWKDLENYSNRGEDRIYRNERSFGDKFKRQMKSIQSGVSVSFYHFWNKMNSEARSGLNKVITTLNSAIGSIDRVVSEFGGNKSAVHKVAHLATGTGVLGGVRRPITQPTLAILNDGSDSPETNNEEAVWDTNSGQIGVVHGKNVPMILRPNQEVFNATESRMLGLTSPEHFAGGTGGLKRLYETAKHNWEKPKKTGQALFSSINGLSGAINQLAQGMNKDGSRQGIKWWEQLWKMVGDKVNDGDGPASGLLKAVEKYGEGHHYVWGGSGPSVFDCSGLVMYALKHAYGIDYPHFSGAQYARTAHIPKSEARMGDLVFWGKGGSEHVGVYAGGNRYFSAESPSQGIHMNSLDSVVGYAGPYFGRVRGANTHGSDSEKVKANTKLQKQIRDRVGKGFWKTIIKIAEKYGDAEYGGNVITEGMIEAAARRMHVHLPEGFAKDIIRVAMSETGNRNIHQQVRDINTGWNEATGPLQFTPRTFAHYAVPGHRNIHSPYDQLLAFFNNAWWRHSIGWANIWGHTKYEWLGSGPHGPVRYARGGIADHPQIAEVGDGQAPEAIIPWDQNQRSRAYAIMQATLDNFKAQDGKTQMYQNQGQQAVDLSKTNDEIDSINAKFDEALSIIGVLASQPQTIRVDNYLDKRELGYSLFQTVNRLNENKVRSEAHRISGNY